MSRFIIYGAGGIGSSVGACLFLHQRDVVLITRGKHREEIASNGLRYETPTAKHTLAIPVVGHPSEIEFQDDDVVLMTMKLQDSADALRTLAGIAPSSTPVVCMQNGVDGERMALRMFRNVYGCLVVSPAEYLEPGLVLSRATPEAGFFDLGRYPTGSDDRARAISAQFGESNLISRVRDDIMAWKYAKLLRNLGNAVQALISGHAGDTNSPLMPTLQAEARAVYRAAGIEPISDAQYSEQTKRSLGVIPGRTHGGSSTWQSFARGTGSVESDYLNGEIVLLGRLHGIATPANELLQQLSNEHAYRRAQPGALAMDEFMKRLESVSLAS